MAPLHPIDLFSLRIVMLTVVVTGVLYLWLIVLPPYQAGITAYTQAQLIQEGDGFPVPPALATWVDQYGGIVLVLGFGGRCLLVPALLTLYVVVLLSWKQLGPGERWGWLVLVTLLLTVIVFTWRAGGILIDIFAD